MEIQDSKHDLKPIVPESKGAKLNWKKIDWMKIGIALLILVVIAIAGYMLLKPASASGLKTGDSANLAYTFIVGGKTIADNESKFSIGQVAQQFGVDSSKIDDALVGLKKGDSVTVTLKPSEAYGEYDPSLIETINRTQSVKRVEDLNRTVTIPMQAFSMTFNEQPVLNKTYTPSGAPWDYKVLSYDNSSVTLSQEVTEGKIIPINEFMFAKVTKVTADRITTERSLNEENKTVDSAAGNLTVYSDNDNIYFTLTPEVNATIPLGTSYGKVVSFNETSIIFDTNHPFAGQEVEFRLKVMDVKPVTPLNITITPDAGDVKGAPTLQAFVVSYCPYGLQMEKGMIPVYELLKGKANLKIRFLSPMHGQQEEDENNRQICIREETNQFWPYLQCFVDKGTASACLKQVGVDEAKITDCMANRAKGYMDIDNQLNTQYGGISSSPTTIVNDEEVQIYPRSPADVLKALCNAFTTKPSECSQTLDSANPSPGFGLSASSSASSAASCGA